MGDFVSRLLTCFLLLVFGLTVAACTGSPLPPAVGAVPPAATVSSESYRLGAGDKVRIALYGDESFKGEFEVASDGTLSLPLIGAQPVGGLTVGDARKLIETKLGDGFYRDPRVSAEVINFRPFYILGEVNRPGTYPYVSGLTLSQAVAIAGGYTYRANLREVALKRAAATGEVRVAADQALEVGPGDTVRVLERYF